MPVIVPVVEGDGEAEALPVLIRRVLGERLHQYGLSVGHPKNAHGKDRLVRDLEKYVQYALMIPGSAGVLVLLDADGDCARDLAVGLAERIRALGLSKPVAIACATQEYEGWFLASLESIRGRPIKGRPGLSEAAHCDGSTETVADAKALLTRFMPSGRAYKETTDQAPLTAYLDLSLVYERSRSFRRLCHAVEELFNSVSSATVAVTP